MLTAGLGRRFFKNTENRINARLIARPLRLEPFQNVGVDAQRDECLWRDYIHYDYTSTKAKIVGLTFDMSGGLKAAQGL